MTRARKPCPTPGCANLEPCAIHAPKPWASSDRGKRLSSRPWGRRRRYVLARDPICKDGRVCGHRALSDEVDHIVPGDDHSYENLQGICVACHKAKTQQEAAQARARR